MSLRRGSVHPHLSLNSNATTLKLPIPSHTYYVVNTARRARDPSIGSRHKVLGISQNRPSRRKRFSPTPKTYHSLPRTLSAPSAKLSLWLPATKLFSVHFTTSRRTRTFRQFRGYVRNSLSSPLLAGTLQRPLPPVKKRYGL